MERTTIDEARLIFKENFIGLDDLLFLFVRLHPFGETKFSVPEIPWGINELKAKADNYILILGIPSWGGVDLNIRNLRNCLGWQPELSEPCFYNQDWYINEKFIDETLELKWYLIRKHVFDDSRAVDPHILIERDINFPSAILCCYTFFAFWFARGIKLWEYDFLWCSDKDHNGDRIYVGKYTDIDGINKNGFSIHRHLALRLCYSAIDYSL